MRIPAIYLETTIFNFPFVDDARNIMLKTFNDYLNDPRLKDESVGLRMAHAMRFKVQDDTAGMTPAEEAAYYHEGTQTAFSRLGMMPKFTSPYRESSV